MEKIASREEKGQQVGQRCLDGFTVSRGYPEHTRGGISADIE